MLNALAQFDNSIALIKDNDALYEYLVENQKLPNDLSDILRAELVYAVSALDKLIHELVRIGMIQIFLGNRPKTAKFENFSISLKTYTAMQYASIESPVYFFEQEIVMKHKHLSFQEPEKIADALSLIWDEKQKWQKISASLNMSDDQVRKKLKIIVNRRNQIVHEADIDIQTNIRSNIDRIDVINDVDFIDRLGQSIFTHVQIQ
jgi:hypothetical protein